MTYTTKRKAGNRLIYRGVGVIFIIAGIAGIRYGIDQWSGMTRLFFVIFTALCFVGLNYILQSFRMTAYSITYEIKEDGIYAKTKHRKRMIPYNEIANVKLQKIDENMKYFVMTIQRKKKYPLVLHFVNEEKEAQKMYELLSQGVAGQKEGGTKEKRGNH